MLLLLAPATAQEPLPDGFVYLRDFDPTIVQDMRYAGADNFTGRPLPGYDAAECVLKHETAAALKQVQADLASEGLALKVYDCYRPRRASRAMAQWATTGDIDGKRHFPRLQKNALFALGYIALSSAHATGSAVDLTLVRRNAAPAAVFNQAGKYGSCAGPIEQRGPDTGIDMGTGFDCFDAASHTRSPAITDEQRAWRTRLVAAMAKHGFHNYFREWWHFTYAPRLPAASYDFPVRPRPPG